MPVFYLQTMKYYLYIIISFLILQNALGVKKRDILDLHNQCYSLLKTNIDSAIILSEVAEIEAAKLEDNYLQAQSLYIRSYAYKIKKDLGKSFVLNLKALEFLHHPDSDKTIKTKIELLQNTGLILKQHYAYSESILYYDDGIELALKNGINDNIFLAPLYYNKALSLRHTNQLNEALASIDECLKIAINYNDEARILRSLNQKGLILNDLKRFQKARETYSEIIQFDFVKQSPAKFIGQAWHNTALTYLGESHFRMAKAAYQKAIHFKENENKAEDLFISYHDLSETLLNLDELNQASKYAKKCLALYEQCDLDPDNYKFFNLMSEIAYRQNKPKLVREYSQKYFDENEKFLTQQREILEVKDRYKMEVLTAGFFSELHADQNISLLERVLWTVGILFTCILLITRIYTYLRKRSLSIQITQIKEEGTV